MADNPIALEPFTAADVPRLIAWIPTQHFLLQWGGPYFTWPLTVSQFDDYLEPTRGDAPTRLVFRAVERRTRAVVGHVELTGIDRERHVAGLARILIGEPEHRGAGLGTAMVAAALDLAVDDLSIARVDLNVFDFNVAAIRCYERLGFTSQGPATETWVAAGRQWQALRMSITEQVWRHVRRGLRWQKKPVPKSWS